MKENTDALRRARHAAEEAEKWSNAARAAAASAEEAATQWGAARRIAEAAMWAAARAAEILREMEMEEEK
jgi:hypothetical protein